MKTYVDSDVILDVQLGREAFLIESSGNPPIFNVGQK